MKKILIIAGILSWLIFMCVMACAEPYFNSGPNSGATKYLITFTDTSTEESLSNPDGSMYHDIESWSGSVNGDVKAGSEYILNGEPQGVWGWSDPVPFDLQCPSETPPGNFSINQ